MSPVADVASFTRVLDPVRTIAQGRAHKEAVPAEVTEFMTWKPSTHDQRERMNA